jgi:hypothetical protein
VPHPAPPAAGTVVVVPDGAIILDPYHAATPYNPAVVNQAMPSPALNRPVTTLPCINPNQNFDPFERTKPGCGGKKGWFKKDGCGCGKPCTPPDGALGQMTHPYCGVCSKGGSFTTGCNTANFVLGSSRSFFGESSREFFERPASEDGIKMKPKAYSPPPAPGAYIPANAVVIYMQAPPKQAVGVFPPQVAGKSAE